MNKKRPLYKIILTDIAGVLLIIAAVLFGWLPGPGGVPLLLGGLGLLALNHEWARRLLTKLKNEGVKFMDRIFVEHKWVVICYDVITVLLVVTGVSIFYSNTQNIWRSLAIVCFVVGLGIFFGNRKRWKYFSSIGQKKKQ